MDFINFFDTIRSKEPVDVSSWKYFTTTEIFDVKTGASISKRLLSDGNTPRITVTALNNGIGGKYQE